MERIKAIWKFHPNEPWLARTFTVLLLLCTAIILWDSGIWGGDAARSIVAEGWHLAFFTVLMCGAECLPVRLPQGQGRLSVSFAIVYASIISFGPVVGASIAGIGVMLANFIQGKYIDIWLFNATQIFLSAWLAGQAWVYFSGGFGQVIAFPGHLVPLIATSGVYLITNVILCTVSISLAYRMRPQTVWLANVRWALPHTAIVSILGVLVLFLYQSTAGIVGVLLLWLPLLAMRYSFQQYIDLRISHLETIQSLVAALDAKDRYTHGHSERVAQLAFRIAEALRLRESDLEAIRYAGLLHDIGKIAIDDSILNKVGRLTTDEISIIRTHPSVGADIVRPVRFLAGVSEMIRHHHEWYNGNGYPGGLRGAAIPLGARILSVADAFDAMTMDRVYRAGRDEEDAITQLIEGKGTQFDPEIVDVFVNEVWPSLRTKETGNYASPLADHL